MEEQRVGFYPTLSTDASYHEQQRCCYIVLQLHSIILKWRAMMKGGHHLKKSASWMSSTCVGGNLLGLLSFIPKGHTIMEVRLLGEPALFFLHKGGCSLNCIFYFFYFFI
jgi:hypothetical protein